MSPGGEDMSAGPPPPGPREPGGENTPPPMPPSIMSGQGQQRRQADQQSDSLQKQTMGLAMQALLEYKNSLEKLLTAFKAIDPESVALFIPAIETGKALEGRFKQVTEKAGAQQPSMAGQQGGASPEPQPPGGQSAQGV